METKFYWRNPIKVAKFWAVSQLSYFRPFINGSTVELRNRDQIRRTFIMHTTLHLKDGSDK